MYVFIYSSQLTLTSFMTKEMSTIASASSQSHMCRIIGDKPLWLFQMKFIGVAVFLLNPKLNQESCAPKQLHGITLPAELAPPDTVGHCRTTVPHSRFGICPGTEPSQGNRARVQHHWGRGGYRDLRLIHISRQYLRQVWEVGTWGPGCGGTLYIRVCVCTYMCMFVQMCLFIHTCTLCVCVMGVRM